MPDWPDTSSTSLLLVLSAVLLFMLGMAAWSDLRSRRVSNQLNASLLAAGVVSSVMMQGLGTGLAGALGGMGMAFAIWMPMYALRLMGGGDVKLMLASGAWLGWQGMLVASLATGAAGGVLGAFWLLRARGAFATIQTLISTARQPWMLRSQPYVAKDRVPYAVAIAIGVSTAWVAVWWPRWREVFA